MFSALEFFSPEHDVKLYRKKLPPSMQVQKVIGLAQRLFNTGTEVPKLAYISSKVKRDYLNMCIQMRHKVTTLTGVKVKM